ncbi:uncharacterized protein N7503_005236 [Penicillium pulvis]|uniref:uncharacterized protein n=1 Tax=Penicillium pulvis TaxID=1562058 RepID=UPI002546B6DC|nr:uncharacterized protein N7503_005236 [Penicillium pulvis]KAJ5802786.1 hypothetical protein N7503_005236 [Penicillium pulvis]
MEFPRKRAKLACEFCRYRKRKCDGERPTCAFCASAGAQCEYKDGPNEKDVDPSVEILQRLDQLENLVRQQSAVITALSDRLLSTGPSPETLHWSQNSPSNLQSTNLALSSPAYVTLARDMQPMDSRPKYEKAEDGPLLIPLGHQTPTGNLLTLDKIKRLIGDYPQDYFLFLESERRLQPLIPRVSYTAIVERLNLRRSITDSLVSSFFSNIHAQFPVLDRKPFLEMFEKFLHPYQEPDMSAALCLMTLALGEICTNPSANFDIESSEVGNGTDYFAHGYQILTTVETAPFSRDLTVPLAFFYASLYFRLQERDIAPGKQVVLVRIAWACYVLECDDLAEFHFPRSGIEVLVDELHFPEFTDPSDRNNLKFLAMCSIRKLLNRIHSTMYASNAVEPNGRTVPVKISGAAMASTQQPSIASLEAVNKELSRQLKAWFDALPDTIKPDLQNPNPRDLHDSQLRTRYYATKHVICRPCLVFAAQSQDAPLSGYIMANCEACVDSCRHFIRATVPLLKRRTHSTWLRLQALLAAVFVISMAKGTPSLASLVPDFEELIEQAILCTKPWAVHHGTADAILEIFKTIRRKLRFPSHFVLS